MKKDIKFLLISILIMFANVIIAANSIEFTLEKESGHYYTTTTLNGIESRIMIESGIPALLISRQFYESHHKQFNLDLKKSDKRMRLLHKQYDINFTAEGQIKIGNAIYIGPIFILDGDIVPLVPLQFLKNPVDGSSIISLDLNNKKLSLHLNDELNRIAAQCDSFPLKLSNDKMPIVNSTLNMHIANKACTMQGDFIVDMGNGSLLFLMKQHHAVKQMINENELTLLEAKNPQGVVVAEGLYADTLTICGKSFEGVSLGVTDAMSSIKEAGFLGIKYFTTSTIFDFEAGKMYVKK